MSGRCRTTTKTLNNPTYDAEVYQVLQGLRILAVSRLLYITARLSSTEMSQAAVTDKDKSVLISRKCCVSSRCASGLRRLR